MLLLPNNACVCVARVLPSSSSSSSSIGPPVQGRGRKEEIQFAMDGGGRLGSPLHPSAPFQASFGALLQVTLVPLLLLRVRLRRDLTLSRELGWEFRPLLCRLFCLIELYIGHLIGESMSSFHLLPLNCSAGGSLLYPSLLFYSPSFCSLECPHPGPPPLSLLPMCNRHSPERASLGALLQVPRNRNKLRHILLTPYGGHSIERKVKG